MEINSIFIKDKKFDLDSLKYTIIEEAVHSWEFDYFGLTDKVQKKFLDQSLKEKYRFTRFLGNIKGVPKINFIDIRERDKFLMGFDDEQIKHTIVKAISVKIYELMEGNLRGPKKEHDLSIDSKLVNLYKKMNPELFKKFPFHPVKDYLKFSISELVSKLTEED
ncbi:MAG: hypothetical protein ACTSQP_05715 [Promethearchaeota archaeon]